MPTVSFDDFHEFVAHASATGWLDGPAITATYASSASDTRPIALLHPTWLASRGITLEVAANVFVYVDRAMRVGHQAALVYEGTARQGGARTRVIAESVEGLELGGIAGTLQRVVLESRDPAYGRRSVIVAALCAENAQVAALEQRTDWTADVFIGVCDGCRLGGNRLCVNDISRLSRASQAELDTLRTRRWWITDHLGGFMQIGEPAPGELVTPNDPRIPIGLRKCTLLATDWGRYGHGGLGSATLFSVERTD